MLNRKNTLTFIFEKDKLKTKGHKNIDKISQLNSAGKCTNLSKVNLARAFETDKTIIPPDVIIPPMSL